MIVNSIAFVITGIILLIASYTDLKTREVPDWVNYGFIISGIAINLLASIIFKNYSYIVNSVAGFLAFLILGYIMFYTGQWGGGDSKAIMGIGAMIGLDISFRNFPFLLSLLINILIIGALYGLVWSIGLAFKNINQFVKEFKKIINNKKFIHFKKYVFIFSIILVFLIIIVDTIMRIPLFLILIFIFALLYLYAFVKAVEKACMIKYVEPMKLTEGDWILKDVVIDGKRITGPKDLGISKKQIKQLIAFYKRKKIKNVAIKEGIPFVPSFLIGFLVSLLLLYFRPETLGSLVFLVV